MIALLREVSSGDLRPGYDRTDPEMSLLRQRLAPEVQGGGLPDLLGVTAMARDAALADVMEIAGMTGAGLGTIAVFTGIVVHGPFGQEFVAPDRSELRWPQEPGRPPEPLPW